MKKLAGLLAMSMLLGSLSLNASAAVEFQEIPEDISGIEIDRQKPIDNLLLGAWTTQVALSEESDEMISLYFYAPETSKICEKALLVILDSGVKAADFLE